jgi:multiple sugar transport system permease protein
VAAARAGPRQLRDRPRPAAVRPVRDQQPQDRGPDHARPARDLHESIIIPSLISAFGVFLLRQFFLTIPNELEDAARIDGAGFVTIFRRIFLPLAGPGPSTLAIVAFNFHWNEFLRPLLFLSSWERMTLPLGLTILRGYLGTGNVAAIMAGISLAIIPVLILFLLTQRYLIEGITLTGLKG